MERTFLEGLKLEKDVVDQIIAEHGKTITGLKKSADDLKAEKEGLKTQLDDVTKKLDGFKDVDLDALKGEIEKLNSDIAEKDTKHKQELADRDFAALVKESITGAKGKSEKAIMALLDIETLKNSKNQKEDIASAIKAISESDAYLFGETQETNASGAKVSSGGAHTEGGTPDDSFMAAALKGAGIETGKEG